ncbi:MAG: prephenate dehydrogenase [Anaerolineae bacterium]|nr:prephenate dehydrogenase [Anaerolineae bacterium]MDW8067431.1 prephenate dehydrogenase [Anaerolineae bacterium]
MNTRITIIGLGCVGSSIGLALRKREPSLEVIGHDIDPTVARKAAQRGAVSKTHWNLPAACEQAAMVILALPLPAVRETLGVVGPHLEEGCVVTDTATLKVPVLEWARKSLPAHVRFVTGLPIPGPKAPVNEPLMGADAARADLFEDGFYCITPAADTDPDAVTALLGLIQAIGARPLFMDPIECDGLQAGAADLPTFIAVALLRTLVESPGWTDMRKLLGYHFALLTGPVVADAAAWRMETLLNRENLLRRLDMFLEEVSRIRQWLLENDEQALESAYTQAAWGRARWLQERARGMPEGAGEPVPFPSMGEQIARMFFGDLVRRRPPEGNRSP